MSEKQELVCDGCHKTLRIPEKFWGKKVRCPGCSEVLTVPEAPPLPPEMELDDVEFVEDEDPFADLAPGAVAAPPRQRTSSPTPKRKKKKTEKPTKKHGGAFGLERRMLGSGVLGGIGLMVAAVIWFVVGLAAGWIFYYPPIMFIFGMVATIKGLLRSE